MPQAGGNEGEYRIQRVKSRPVFDPQPSREWTASEPPRVSHSLSAMVWMCALSCVGLAVWYWKAK